MKPVAVTTGSGDGVGPLALAKALHCFSSPHLVQVYGTCPPPIPIPEAVLWENVASNNSLKALLSACSRLKEKHHQVFVTGPVRKSEFQSYGQGKDIDEPILGHTEILADYFQSNVCMAFLNTHHRVALMTQHIPLREVPNRLTTELIVQKVSLFASFLKKRLQKETITLGLCGLNPHPLVDNYADSEDVQIIVPAIQQLNDHSMLSIVGPVSADTLFFEYEKNNWDGAISLYHDQSLPFIKGTKFWQSVNVTLGLPFIRVSVDHGVGTLEQDVNETNFLRALEWAYLLNSESAGATHA